MADYPLTIRISKYNRLSTSWAVVLECPAPWIESVRCSFVAPRVEDRAQIVLIDRGSYYSTFASSPEPTWTNTQTAFLDNYNSLVGPLYRLDIFAPETSEPTDGRSLVSSWLDGHLFWSGFIDVAKENKTTDRPGLELSCLGWTAYLDRIVIHDKFYKGQTLAAISSDLFTYASQGIEAQWPGNIGAVIQAGSTTAQNLVVEEIGWKAATMRQIFDELSAFGNFSYGVSVSGYPYLANSASQGEFAFISFSEPVELLDLDDDRCETFIDVDNDPRVVDWKRWRDDSRYTTRWVFQGESPYVDFVSVITGHDRDDVRDSFAYSSGPSGAFQWEPGGFVGWTLQITDQAERTSAVDKETGVSYPAGRLRAVPTTITRKDGDATFLITSYTESGGEAIFEVKPFPAPTEDSTLDISEGALRYTLAPGPAIRVTRVVMDEEQDDATQSLARERITKLVSDSAVRGWLQAGIYAAQERAQERLAAVRAELRIREWTRYPSGSSRYLYGRLAISEGPQSGRMTLLGTTAQGGDDYQMGDDDRVVGRSLIFDIRRSEFVYTESGWDARFDLGGTPRDLATVILPDTVRSKHKRRN